jgi:hypothetical protein
MAKRGGATVITGYDVRAFLVSDESPAAMAAVMADEERKAKKQKKEEDEKVPGEQGDYDRDLLW